MGDLAAEVKKLKGEVAWLKKGLMAVGTLAVKTDENCGQLLANKRLILFLNGDAVQEVLKKYKTYCENRDLAQEKLKHEDVEKKEMEMEVGDAPPGIGAKPKESKPHWGTEIFLMLLEGLNTIMKDLAKDNTISATVLAGIQTTLSELKSRDPMRITKYAFPHTKEPSTEKSTWVWTLHLSEGESASAAREALLWDLQPLMRKQNWSVKADNPTQEGGTLRKEARTSLGLPAPKQRAKAKTKKRGAGPASPIKEGTR
jgi:hypothetical protein